MRVFLIGMPGVGKSKTGKCLAKKLGYQFIDLDSYIEERHGSILDIFQSEGEEAFRKYEHEALIDLKDYDNIVVSTGGGIITKAYNRPLMRPGMIFYLNASLKLIKSHIGNNKNRPLLSQKSIEDLFYERKEKYEYFMDYKVNYESYVDAVDKILKVVNEPVKKKILVVNGPNLNLLGKRDPKEYGAKTLNDINNLMKEDESFDFEFYQSNVEGFIVDKLQEYEKFKAIIINPGAYTHTSIAIHDCLEVINILKVEVHLSDVDNREDFRKVNYVRGVCNKTCSGLHEYSYVAAIIYLKNKLNVI